MIRTRDSYSTVAASKAFHMPVIFTFNGIDFYGPTSSYAVMCAMGIAETRQLEIGLAEHQIAEHQIMMFYSFTTSNFQRGFDFYHRHRRALNRFRDMGNVTFL